MIVIDEKTKYLIINATDITKQLYRVERVAYCNDFDNIYHRVEKINANEIFERNNVPDEFRKIIVKISAPILSRKEAYEYTVGFPFDFANKTREERDNVKYIRMNNWPIYYNGCIFDDKIEFKAKEQYTSFNNVIYFLEAVYNNGCIENYLQSIKEFFDVDLDLEILFGAWNETHNKGKALKLYKHRVISKKI